MAKAPEGDGKILPPDTTLVVTDSQLMPATPAPPPPPPAAKIDPEVSMWAGAVVIADEFRPAAAKAAKAARPAPRRRWPWVLAGLAAAVLLAASSVTIALEGPWHRLPEPTVAMPPEPAEARPAAATPVKKKPAAKPARRKKPH